MLVRRITKVQAFKEDTLSVQLSGLTVKVGSGERPVVFHVSLEGNVHDNDIEYQDDETGNVLLGSIAVALKSCLQDLQRTGLTSVCESRKFARIHGGNRSAERIEDGSFRTISRENDGPAPQSSLS